MIRKIVADRVEAVIESNIDALIDEIATEECDRRVIKRLEAV